MAADLEVVELTPGHADDYAALFDRSFADNPEWAGCYCWFHDDASGLPWDSSHEQAAEHRRLRTTRIRAGEARGLLAYLDGTAVGWCYVAPRSEIPNLRFAVEAVQEPEANPAVIMCFVIDPEHRGQGVATALLSGAIEASARWGVPWLEGYPADTAPNPDDEPFTTRAYTGPASMYRAAGFEIAREMDGWQVVRHPLR